MKTFTYHLFHIPTGKHYYGARYKKGCHPAELWTTYFTSSLIVAELIEQYGKDSFIATVRKVFETPEEAVEYETRFLNKIDARNSDKWLNRHNGGKFFKGVPTHSKEARSKMSLKTKGIKKSEETREKMKVAAKKREAQRRANGWKMPPEATQRALETRQKRMASGEVNPYSAERNAKMAKSKTGTKRHYLPDGSFIMIKP